MQKVSTSGGISHRSVTTAKRKLPFQNVPFAASCCATAAFRKAHMVSVEHNPSHEFQTQLEGIPPVNKDLLHAKKPPNGGLHLPQMSHWGKRAHCTSHWVKRVHLQGDKKKVSLPEEKESHLNRDWAGDLCIFHLC